MEENNNKKEKQDKKDCNKEEVREQIIQVLKNVYDPEIPVDIWNLGLIYKLEIDEDFNVEIEMTLTAPGCPVAGDIIKDVYYNTTALPCVNAVDVNLTFDPPWNQDMMSEEAKLQLGFM